MSSTPNVYYLHYYHEKQLLIDAITSARDVHKAMREAQQAAKEAEICYEMTELSVSELNKLLGQICTEDRTRF